MPRGAVGKRARDAPATVSRLHPRRLSLSLLPDRRGAPRRGLRGVRGRLQERLLRRATQRGGTSLHLAANPGGTAKSRRARARKHARRRTRERRMPRAWRESLRAGSGRSAPRVRARGNGGRDAKTRSNGGCQQSSGCTESAITLSATVSQRNHDDRNRASKRADRFGSASLRATRGRESPAR